MSDIFLDEIKRMHDLRKMVRAMTPETKEAMFAELGDDAADDWALAAREAQLRPMDLDWCWLFLGGRGTGKSHAMTGAIHSGVHAGLKRIHLIGPTTAAVHDVLLEGPAGLLRSGGLAPVPKFLA